MERLSSLPPLPLRRKIKHQTAQPRILMISDHASPLARPGSADCGGQNVYVRQVAKHLAEMGYGIDIFTRKDDPSLPEILDWENGIRVIHVPAGPPVYVRKEELLPFMDEFTDFVLRFSKLRPYDLVHAHFWMSGLVAAEFKEKTAIPFVITFHALGRVRRIHQEKDDGFPDARFGIEDRIVREADRIIAECPQDMEDLMSLYGGDPRAISVVPCGFSHEEFWPMEKSHARKALGLDSEAFTLLQLGRIVPRKGVDNVIRAFAAVAREIPARLLIVGGDGLSSNSPSAIEMERLQRLSLDLGVNNEVLFAGRRERDELRYFYNAADLFLSTPWYEPFGITPVEAMACGTPVIGSNVGGIKFSVRDGETGYLVPPNDPRALAERILHLARNPALLRAFRKSAIQRANDFFTWRKVSRALAEIYDVIIGTAKRDSNAKIAVKMAIGE